MASDQLLALLEYVQQNGRICPQPKAWDRLWKLLSKQARGSSELNDGQPPAPLILGAWWHTTGLDKMLRLREHMEWADAHGAIDIVDAYVRAIPEEDWFHGRD